MQSASYELIFLLFLDYRLVEPGFFNDVESFRPDRGSFPRNMCLPLDNRLSNKMHERQITQ